MHCDVAIVGGGMGGCIAAAWLRTNFPDWSIVLLEPGELGAAFKSGGLKYLRWDDELADLIVNRGILVSKVEVMGGVLLPPSWGSTWDVGQDVPASLIQPFPGALAKDDIEKLQRIHYKATRGTMDGFSEGVMNWGGREQYRIATGPGLCEALTDGVNVLNGLVQRVEGDWRPAA
mgnify:CR=1 FL=1